MKNQRADTRGRLIDAARQIFYANGYQKATIQMIAARAKANIAAVNYHFGDKASLMVEVLSRDLAELHATMPRISQAPQQPARQLRKFVRWFFSRFEPESKVAPLLRDISYSSDFLDAMMHAIIRPEMEALSGILRALDPGAVEERIQRNAVCAMTLMCNTIPLIPSLQNMFSDCRIAGDDTRAWSEHIADVCIRGMGPSS